MLLETFQLVDEVLSIDEESQEIVTWGYIEASSCVFEHHFPENPVVPGVMLVEFMAQTSGLLLLASTEFQVMPFMSKVKTASFRRFTAPGTEIFGRAAIVGIGPLYSVAKAEVFDHDNARLCNAELGFAMKGPADGADEYQFQASVKRLKDMMPVRSGV